LFSFLSPLPTRRRSRRHHTQTPGTMFPRYDPRNTQWDRGRTRIITRVLTTQVGAMPTRLYPCWDRNNISCSARRRWWRGPGSVRVIRLSVGRRSRVAGCNCLRPTACNRRPTYGYRGYITSRIRHLRVTGACRTCPVDETPERKRARYVTGDAYSTMYYYYYFERL